MKFWKKGLSLVLAGAIVLGTLHPMAQEAHAAELTEESAESLDELEGQVEEGLISEAEGIQEESGEILEEEMVEELETEETVEILEEDMPSNDENGKKEPTSLDDLAWGDFTYRDIFVENNMAYLNGFDDKTFSPYIQNTGINTISSEQKSTGLYSLKSAGTTSQQIRGNKSISVTGEYYVASKNMVVRYEHGTVGICIGEAANAIGISEITDKFVTASNIVKAEASKGIFIGSINNANLDAYTDDTVVLNLELFEQKPTKEQLDIMYENYVLLEKTREREDVLYSDEEQQEAFVAYMNSKAEAIGMKNTNFNDPVGIDNTSTAEDIYRLMLYAKEKLVNIWGEDSFEITVEGVNSRKQTVNATYFAYDLDEYYQIKGGKTGSLSKYNARNLAAYLGIPNSEDQLLVIVMYAEGKDGETNDRYKTAKSIADCVLNGTIENYDAACESAIAAKVSVDGSVDILYQKNKEDVLVPASITKVMTSICALELIDGGDKEIQFKQSDVDRTTTAYYGNDFKVGDVISFEEALYAMILPSSNVTAEAVARTVGQKILEEEIPMPEPPVYDVSNYRGKVISILGDSISTYTGVSNNTSYNSTIGSNAIYYSSGTLGIYQQDTWWQQVIDVLDMKLLVNNSWSGSTVYPNRLGAASVGYSDRCVNLHNDITGEEPDVIVVFLGTNDVSYYQSTLGNAEFDYDTLIMTAEDGSYTYASPTTTCEAYAIMMHKIKNRYPEAEIYCMNMTARRDPDYADSYADVGQPTEFNAELAKIIEHYDATLVDLENCGIDKDAATFDLYMGDKRVHPNAVGMDQITEALLEELLGEQTDLYDIETDLDNVVLSEENAHAFITGSDYKAVLTASKAFSGIEVTVTMGGMDITDDCYADGVISIPNVTGDIEILAKAVGYTDTKNYRWDLVDGALTSTGENVNELSMLAGSVTDGKFVNARYQLKNSVILNHDNSWVIEWKGLGTGGFMLAEASDASKAPFFFRRAGNYLNAFGSYDGSKYNNYGVALESTEIDGSAEHVYRLENHVSDDGTNMVDLYVDGVKIGPLNNYYVGGNAQGTTGDWICGRDFCINYIGTTSHPLTNYSMEYLQVWENTSSEASVYRGKVVSILGDSISTFAGYIPKADGFNLEHLARYPQDNLLTDVNETWWMQVITRLDGKLGINDSWRGATVSGAASVTSGTSGENASMSNLTRIQNLGSNGTPDVILFYGGTNDLAHVSKVGSFEPSTAPETVDLTTKKWDNLADGYVHTLLRLQHYYPDAQIVCVLPTYTTSYYSDEKLAQGNEVLANICEHYGVPYVDLRKCGIGISDLPDGIHPDATGMDYISSAVIDCLLAQCEVETGENTVYTVTHKLENAKASLGYYKGISKGKSFVETITGNELKVTVVMDGKDITSSAYADGKISIAAVTGNLIIQVQGEREPAYTNHLQQIPKEICSGTNLWTKLEHDKEYYTANGWDVHSSGEVYSVTIPINPGDHIWATSFQKSGMNGSTIDGIRLTWFGEVDVIESVSPDKVYEEFNTNGYLTAPEGAVAVNIPMWNNSPDNELYILNLEHKHTATVTEPTCKEQGYTTYTCTCGDSYVGDETLAKGHTEVIEPEVKATFDADGKTDKVTCSACKEVLTPSEIVSKVTANLETVSYEYDGQIKTPSVVVKSGNNTLVEGIDYVLTYDSGRENAGTYSVTVDLQGKYAGSQKLSFKIDPTDNISEVALSKTNYTYNGKSKKPTVTAKDSNGKTLKSGTDYSVSYASGRTKIGKYKVTVTFKGNYSGKKTLYFEIGPKNPSTVKTVLYGHDDVKVSWSKVSGATGYKVYYKKSSASKYTLLKTTTGTSYKKSGLSGGVKYTFKVVAYKKVSGNNCENVGKTSSIYTLKKIATPTLSASSGMVKVKWTNISGETGYQISQSTSKSKTNVVATYKTTSGTSKKVSAAKGKKYYYKVRAYKVVDGKNIYGPWSSVVSYKR